MKSSWGQFIFLRGSSQGNREHLINQMAALARSDLPRLSFDCLLHAACAFANRCKDFFESVFQYVGGVDSQNFHW